ncbi:hypothetical protein [Dethiothermospora halolimnae]
MLKKKQKIRLSNICGLDKPNPFGAGRGKKVYLVVRRYMYSSTYTKGII